jgi:hypothetical protein
MTRPHYAAALALVGVLTTVGGGTAWACHTPSPPSDCVYQGRHQEQCPTTTTTSSTTATTISPKAVPPTTPPPTTVPTRTTVPPPTTVPPTTTVPSTTVPPIRKLTPATTVPPVTTTTSSGDCIYQGHHQQVCPTATVVDSPGVADNAQPGVPALVGASDVTTADAVTDGTGQLAFTGSDIGMWVCLAGVLLILGVALVVLPGEIAKRRR